MEKKDKFIITLTAKFNRFDGATPEQAVKMIKQGMEEICGEIFDIEVEICQHTK